MPGQISEQIKKKLFASKNLTGLFSVDQERMKLEMFLGQFSVPDSTSIEAIRADGVAGQWIRTDGVAADKAIIYLHGGAFLSGSLKAYQAGMARLSAVAHVSVLAVDYRLAPEHPFPAAIEDAVTVYRWLLSQGYRAENLVIAGDSAGGCLALSTLLALREAALPLPAGAVVFSPATDLTCTSETLTTNREIDPMLTPEYLAWRAKLYLGETNPRHPLASPLFANLRGLPPLLIQVGTDEIQLNDSTYFAAKAEEAGVHVKLEIWDGMWHGWHAFAEYLPEAQQALQNSGHFVQKLFEPQS